MKILHFSVFLISLKLSCSINIREVKNNIISFNGPKTFIVEQNHILMYHYNLSQIQTVLDKHEEYVNQIKTDNFDKMTTSLRDMTINQLLSNKRTLNELIPSRNKRGLINIGGRISKFLFGTLDDEDETLYQEYFQKIQGNLNTLDNNQKRIISVIDSISNNFQNQSNIMVKQLNEFMNMQQALDKIILIQFEQVRISKLLSEINTAVSFARLHLLHESILPLNYFKKYIRSNELLKHLTYLKDFYSVCFTSVEVHEEQIVFIIKVPLVNPNPFFSYELYYVPFLNTYPIDQPKYLLTHQEDIKWILDEECQMVESWMLCPQNKLISPPKCFDSFMKKKKESCARISATKVNSDLIVLPNGNYLSVFNKILTENCSGQLSYEHEPEKILLINSNCQISNGFKTFHPRRTNHLHYHFQLNDFNPYQIQNLTITPFNITDSLELELYKWNVHPNHISTFYFVFSIVVIGSVCFILYKLFILKFKKLIIKQSSSPKIELSSLK